MSSPAIIYAVDADDRIVSVNEAWDHFATRNDGAAVLGAQIVGRNLFEFIGDASTRQIYRQMLARIRSGRHLDYRFRCDSPDCRRLMEMQVRGSDSRGGVEFRSITLESHPRAPIRLPQADGDAAEPIAPQRACGWCNRLAVDGVWMEIEEALPRLQFMETPTAPTLTHGICDSCFAKMRAELDMPAGA